MYINVLCSYGVPVKYALLWSWCFVAVQYGVALLAGTTLPHSLDVHVVMHLPLALSEAVHAMYIMYCVQPK